MSATTTTTAASAPAASSTAATLAALPIVNIAPWLPAVTGSKRSSTPPHTGRLATSAALHAAFLEYGFCYLDVSAFVDPSEPEELTRLARQFFDLPQNRKDGIGLVNSDGARGYQRLKENVTNGKADNHEGIDFYKPVDKPDKGRPLWGENQWPSDEDVGGFRQKYEVWIEKMKVLGMCVMEAMAAGLGMTPEEWVELKSQVDDSFWVMRIIGYPPLPNDYDGYSCGAHKDYGCLTFLYQDPTKGALQVFLPNPELVTNGKGSNGVLLDKTGRAEDSGEHPEALQGGVWVNADPIPGCIVCNIGEMWEIWTNGLYKSTLHRVMHRSSNYRVSIPFFYEPAFDARVQPLAAAIRLQADSASPPHPNRFTHVTYAIDGVAIPTTDDSGSASDGSAKVNGAGTDTSDAVQPQARKVYESVVYGDFLLKKVGGNFDLSAHKPGQPRTKY